MNTEKIIGEELYTVEASKINGDVLNADEWNAVSDAAKISHEKINSIIDDLSDIAVEVSDVASTATNAARVANNAVSGNNSLANTVSNMQKKYAWNPIANLRSINEPIYVIISVDSVSDVPAGTDTYHNLTNLSIFDFEAGLVYTEYDLRHKLDPGNVNVEPSAIPSETDQSLHTTTVYVGDGDDLQEVTYGYANGLDVFRAATYYNPNK